MTQEFIPYEQALKMKELGFTAKCFALWSHYHHWDPVLSKMSSVTPPVLVSSKFNLNQNEHCIAYVNNSNYFVGVAESRPTCTQGIEDIAHPVAAAPTFQQAFRWFRNNYGCNGVVEGDRKNGFEFCIYTDTDYYIKPSNNYDTYEEAELELLNQLIEIVKTNKT